MVVQKIRMDCIASGISLSHFFEGGPHSSGGREQERGGTAGVCNLGNNLWPSHVGIVVKVPNHQSSPNTHSEKKNREELEVLYFYNPSYFSKPKNKS